MGMTSFDRIKKGELLRAALLVLAVSTTLPGAQAMDRYEITDGTLQGSYVFYQEAMDPDSLPFGMGDYTRGQLELLVPEHSKQCADRSARCELVNLQLVPASSGRMRLEASLLDVDHQAYALSIELENESSSGTIVGEKEYGVDEANLPVEPRLSRVSFALRPFKNPSGLIVPLVTLESEAVSLGSFGGVYREKRTHLLMRAEDKED